jgi:Protein of unknown function (DUF1552)
MKTKFSHSTSATRRHFLRGLGVAMGLPWFESLPSFGQPVVRGTPQAPIRLGICFFGNGVNPKHWGAEALAGGGMKLRKSLRPLESLKRQVNVFQGLWNPASNEGPGGHYPKMNVLSGLRVKQTTTDIELGQTFDQIVAEKIGHHTPVPSLVIGTEGPGFSTDNGYTSLYSSFISWHSATQPAPKEIYPQQAFDQLFDDGSQRQRDKSILDLVHEEARSLRQRISRRDGQKLDEYLTSVRELEQRIQRTEQRQEAAAQAWQPSVKTPWLQRPGPELPQQQHEHLRLMLDIMVLAFQMDRTRVVSQMMTNDLSGMKFDFMGLKGDQHEMSHHSHDPARLEIYQQTNQYMVQAWAGALQKMQETQEGERTLLENSLMLLTSSLWDGNEHDSEQLPVVLAGSGGGRLRGGRLHDFQKEPNRKLCRLYLSLMDYMGLKTHRFGDAEEALVL